MNNEKTRETLRKIGVKLIAVSFVILGLTLLIDMSLRPIVETVNAYECRRAVSEVINSAVLAELDREDANYSKLVTLSRNESGEVTAIETNTLNVNRLKTSIAERIEREIGRLPQIDINIPVGTLTGLKLLHGRGFDVGMTVSPLGTANTTITSEFTDAGINQTRHRIVIGIYTEVDAVIPGFSSHVPVSTSIVAAETIIVGKVPDAYTHVISDDHDLVGTLQDYGAVID